MASHIAHEVRNSLVPVTLYLSLLRRGLADEADAATWWTRSPPDSRPWTPRSTTCCKFTADRDPQRQSLAVRIWSRMYSARSRRNWPPRESQTYVEVPRASKRSADGDMLRRAILNLLLNALDVMPDGGQLVVTTYSGSPVYDGTGRQRAGLVAGSSARAFEPFFTTKNNGTGLGLAIVERIAANVTGGPWSRPTAPGGARSRFRFQIAAWRPPNDTNRHACRRRPRRRSRPRPPDLCAPEGRRRPSDRQRRSGAGRSTTTGRPASRLPTCSARRAIR